MLTVQPATFVSLGCFKDNNKPPRLLPKLIANKRKEIDWYDLKKTVQACAEEAKKRRYKLVQHGCIQCDSPYQAVDIS